MFLGFIMVGDKFVTYLFSGSELSLMPSIQFGAVDLFLLWSVAELTDSSNGSRIALLRIR